MSQSMHAFAKCTSYLAGLCARVTVKATVHISFTPHVLSTTH